MPSSEQSRSSATKPPTYYADVDKAINLLGPPPHWMLYWGNYVVAALLLGLVILAAWIRYPDEIQVDIQLTTSIPPVVAAAHSNNYIVQVLAEEGQTVVEEQTILLLDSEAEWPAIQALSTFLQGIEALDNPIEVQHLNWEENLSVGALRTSYATLINHVQELQFWLSRDQLGLRAQRIEEQLVQNQQVVEQLSLQLATVQQERALAEANFESFSMLLKKEAATQVEVDQAQSRLLQSQRQLDLQQQLLYQQEQSRIQLEQEKLRLAESYSEEINVAWLALKQQTRSLRQGIEQWEDEHVMVAKTNGTITFLQTLVAGQLLEANIPLWSIVPDITEAPGYQAVGYLGSNDLGKISIGNEALIRLPAYPYREYGQLEGTLAELSLAPQQRDGLNNYRIVLELKNGLTTTYGRDDLKFRQQLPGRALITTESRSFLVRIFDRFKHLRSRLE